MKFFIEAKVKFLIDQFSLYGRGGVGGEGGGPNENLNSVLFCKFMKILFL